MPSVETSHKFEGLDALRGIAALIVVVSHVSDLFGGHVFVHGYLAVDLFFVLSGFVLSFAYQQKLDDGMSARRFLTIRLIRLYPLYLVGLALGLAVFAVWPLHSLPFGWLGPLVLLLLSLFFLPIISRGGVEHFAFPLNFPVWSLFLELVANIFHALFLRRSHNKKLLVVLAASSIGLIACAITRKGLDFGVHGGDILLGIIRVLFPYVAGMVLFRIWKGRSRCLYVWPSIPVCVLIAILAVPQLPRLGTAYDVLAGMIALPLVVFLASYSKRSTVLTPPSISWGESRMQST